MLVWGLSSDYVDWDHRWVGRFLLNMLIMIYETQHVKPLWPDYYLSCVGPFMLWPYTTPIWPSNGLTILFQPIWSYVYDSFNSYMLTSEKQS